MSAYKRCIGGKSQDDFEEKESLRANVGTYKKDFSYEGKNVIAFSCRSISGIRTINMRQLCCSIFFALKKGAISFRERKGVEF